ncbi:unnamed protein product [Lactuca saligna]|uniref:Uncharacterized protein n=1 Tax=Lactuca saligna TaxID=75948 RepID=A0AA35ULR6_LACSI|nr:unnamed protein product [Lactuca saligna]
MVVNLRLMTMKGFSTWGFVTQVAITLSVVYPDSYFEWEIPQGTHNDIKSVDEQLNPRKRKDSFLGGANDNDVGSSSATGDSSTHPPSKKIKLTIVLNDLAK